MTIYISQGRYTAAAIKGMSAKPEDRSEAVAELFAAAGARLISWYLTLGPYDWLIIAEAPDEPTMISAVLAAAAGGSLQPRNSLFDQSQEPGVASPGFGFAQQHSKP